MINEVMQHSYSLNELFFPTKKWKMIELQKILWNKSKYCGNTIVTSYPSSHCNHIILVNVHEIQFVRVNSLFFFYFYLKIWILWRNSVESGMPLGEKRRTKTPGELHIQCYERADSGANTTVLSFVQTSTENFLNMCKINVRRNMATQGQTESRAQVTVVQLDLVM